MCAPRPIRGTTRSSTVRICDTAWERRASGISSSGRNWGDVPRGRSSTTLTAMFITDGVAETDLFQSGLDRLLDGRKRFRVAILCSEENPAECHRFLLVTRALHDRGADVAHIRGDGVVLSTKEISTFEGWSDPVHEEPPLFGEEVKSSWRSTRSASPESRSKISSSR